MLRGLMEDAGYNSTTMAAVLGLTASAVEHKLAGRRRWTIAEALRVTALLGERLKRPVSVEEAFGGTEPTTDEAVA